MPFIKPFMMGFLCFFVLIGCSPTPSNDPEPEVNSQFVASFEVVEPLLNEVYTPAVQYLKESTQALREAAQGQCDLIENTDPNAIPQIILKGTWAEAMSALHRLEVLAIGPLGVNETGAVNALVKLYSWPNTDRCGIDESVVLASQAAGFEFEGDVAKQGLDAIEYLLFDADFDHACADGSEPLSGWNELSLLQRQRLRCSHVQRLSADVAEKSLQLFQSWQQWVGQQTADSSRDTFRQMIHSLLFIGEGTQQKKLGVPTGLSELVPECFGRFCPEFVEHRESGYSFVSIQDNILSVAALFNGSWEDEPQSHGLTNLLVDSGNTQVNNSIIGGLQQFYMRVRNQQPSMVELIESSRGDHGQCLSSTPEQRFNEVCSLYQQLDVISDLIRGDLFSAFESSVRVNPQSDQK